MALYSVYGKHIYNFSKNFEIIKNNETQSPVTQNFSPFVRPLEVFYNIFFLNVHTYHSQQYKQNLACIENTYFLDFSLQRELYKTH